MSTLCQVRDSGRERWAEGCWGISSVVAAAATAATTTTEATEDMEADGRSLDPAASLAEVRRIPVSPETRI